MLEILKIIYPLSPFIILLPTYFILRNMSNKIKYLIGILIGVFSLLILTTRNVMIYLDNDFLHPETIPLQICHIGNTIVFLALVFKNKTSLAIAFVFNLPFAFISLFFTHSYMESWDNFLSYRSLTYIFGHLIIVIGAIYPIMLKYLDYTKKHLYKGIKIIFIFFGFAMISNILFVGLGYNINYYYAHRPEGLPDFFNKFANVGKIIYFPENGANILIDGSSQNFYLDPFYTLIMIITGILTIFIFSVIKIIINKIQK